MNAQLSQIHSEDHNRELLDRAVRFEGPVRMLAAGVAVTVRAARHEDAGALEQLAALDDRPLPCGPLLIGEIGARPLAALSLADRRVIADPFVPTREIVALLQLRARQLRGGRFARLLSGRRRRAIA